MGVGRGLQVQHLVIRGGERTERSCSRSCIIVVIAVCGTSPSVTGTLLISLLGLSHIYKPCRADVGSQLHREKKLSLNEDK